MANITAEYEGFFSEPCTVSVHAQNNVYAVAESDSVTIYHDWSLRNCAFSATMDVQVNNDVIVITEVNDTGDGATCHCLFDLSVTINELTPGSYTAEIYGIDDPFEPDDIDYYGTVEFTIEGNSNQAEPLIGTQYQSDCYDLNE